MKHLDERHGAAVDGLVEFFVDEIVVEVDGSGIGLGVAVIDAFQMGPVNGTEAHRAGLTRGIYHAVGEVEGSQLAAGLPDGIHLGMGGGVVVDGDAVGAASNDFAIFDDDGTERSSAIPDALIGQANGLTHKKLVVFGDVDHDTI